MRLLPRYALLLACALVALAGCFGGPAQGPDTARPGGPTTPAPTITPDPRATPTPLPTGTPTPTQTALPTATAVFPAACPGFRNTSQVPDDELLELYWHYTRARERAIVEFVARAFSVDPSNQEQMGDLSRSQIIAGARGFWENSPQGRARCGDLAPYLVEVGALRVGAGR